MTYFERINEMKNTLTLEQKTFKEDYFKAEEDLVSTISTYIADAEVTSRAYGLGKLVKAEGKTLDAITVDIAFAIGIKRISLLHIMTNNFTNFTALADVDEVWNAAFEVHTSLTAAYKEFEREAKQLAIELEKKAEADKKAEAKYEELKAKALKDFDKLSNRAKAQIEANEFYYALGWLAKHIGTVTATMPDYLSDAFKKYFGMDAVHTVVDSKKKTSNGHAMQWTWSFRASVKKADSVPSCIIKHFNDARKAITDTAFIWDLVEDYGFSFGKKQDVEKIAQTIPAKYIDSFNEGLTA